MVWLYSTCRPQRNHVKERQRSRFIFFIDVFHPRRSLNDIILRAYSRAIVIKLKTTIKVDACHQRQRLDRAIAMALEVMNQLVTRLNNLAIDIPSWSRAVILCSLGALNESQTCKG